MFTVSKHSHNILCVYFACSLPVSRTCCAVGVRFSLQMVHTFSGCVLGSDEECDLDELLATRLVSFLMDHQESILSVPEYLLHAITDHIQHLRTTQVHIYADININYSILWRIQTVTNHMLKCHNTKQFFFIKSREYVTDVVVVDNECLPLVPSAGL